MTSSILRRLSVGTCGSTPFAGRDVAVAETYFFTAHTFGPEAQGQYGASGKGGPVQLSHYGRYVDRDVNSMQSALLLFRP